MTMRSSRIFTSTQHGKLNSIRDKKAANYEREFKAIPLMNTFVPGRTFQGWTSNQDKNRYKNVMCIDQSRVQLSTGEYLHANVATSEGKTIILAQGPTPSTTDTFWRAIFEKNVSLVFMLCQTVENSTPKCHQYYPTTKTPVTTTNFIVRIIQLQYVNGKRDFIKRILAVENKTTHQIHGLVQYQMMSWPDHGIPSDNEILNHMIDKIIKSNGTTLIHCSAGIGRTGTLAVAAFSYLSFKNGTFDSVEQVAKMVREARCQAVQTPQQFWLIHMLFVEAIERNFIGGKLLCSLKSIKSGMMKELAKPDDKKK